MPNPAPADPPSQPFPRTYEGTLLALNSLITGRRRGTGVAWEETFGQMATYLETVGIAEATRGLPVVHVAGTKGKGSTCVFVESVLRASGRTAALFTSPHLVDVRERLRLGGRLIAKTQWTRAFWEVWDKLQAAQVSPMPAYFRFLTLVALYVSCQQRANLDAVILEVGLGGRLDATNVVERPVVCGITHLGLDHVELLGDTVAKIAFEKAGIMKPGVACFTVGGQEADAQQVLEGRAREVGAPLGVAPPLETYAACREEELRLGLAGDHQRSNAALAVALCRQLAAAEASASGSASPPAVERAEADMRLLAEGRLPPAWRAGLEAAEWPGRAQVVQDSGYGGSEQAATQGAQAGGGGGELNEPSGSDECPAACAAAMPNLTFFMDGAHTPESMTLCAKWFTHARRPGEEEATRDSDDEVALLFNIMDERSPEELLRPLHEGLRAEGVAVHRAYFVPPNSSYTSVTAAAAGKQTQRSLEWQENLRSTWERLSERQSGQRCHSAVVPSLGETLTALRQRATAVRPAKVRVLVTGSLYIIGDLLKMLRRAPN